MSKSASLLIGVLTAILLFVCSSQAGLAQKRFALLIGNRDYAPNVGPLKNPIHDIENIAKALDQIGFKGNIVQIKNATRLDISREVSRFAEKLEAAGENAIGFLYYSGHGAARGKDRVNYLIPVDVTDMSNEDFWFNSVSLDSILKELQTSAPKAAEFVVFDACRSELRLPSKSLSKGFQPMDQTNGLFIAFSTSPNDTASDAGDNGGPYSRSLAIELVHPGQDQLTLFQNVKERVFGITGNTQRPWESNGFISRVYLDGAPPQPSKPADEAAHAWNLIQFATDQKIFENFIQIYSESGYAQKARARLAELKALPAQPPTPATPNSKIVLSLLPNSPIYSRGDIMKIKITAASNRVKAFAVFPFGPPERSRVEASYNAAEGGLYIPYKIPTSVRPGHYTIPVYVQELNSKLEERQVVYVEVRSGS